MARTVLPIVGAVVGAYFGQPQLGYAIGAVIGNAVDPVKVQGPRLGETGVQTSAEGAPRAIIYGVISCTGNVIVAGPLVLQEVETSEGKGGGPVTSTEHGYRTYAIRICEGPVAGILRIWEDDKLVYDVRTTSSMLDESAKWVAGSTIYLGTETQLPDPTLETQVNSDMPAYRGTAYMVFGQRDLTDRRGSIPQYRFEVAKTITPATWPGYEWSIVQSTGWTGPSTVASGNGITVASGQGDTSWHSTDLETWQPASTPFGLSIIANLGAVFVGINTGNNNQSANGPGFNWTSHAMASTYQKTGLAAGNGLFVAIGQFGVSPVTQRVSVSADNGQTWTDNTIGNGGTGVIRFANGVFVAGLSASQYAVSADGVSWTLYSAPFATMEDFVWSEELGLWLVIGGTSGSAVATSPDLVNWTIRTTPSGNFSSGAWSEELGLFAIGGDSFATSPDGINWTGHATMPTGSYDQLIWESVNSKFVSTSISPSQIVVSDTTAGSIGGLPVPLSEIVADIHDRCNVHPEKFDVSELTDLVQGLLLAGDYSGADAINTLRAPYFFDKFEADKKLHYPKRGHNTVFTIDIDDLVEEPDVSKREQAIEYPKKMHMQYQHANSGYAVVKATSSRSSPDARVIGENAISVPVVLTENEAAQTIAKLHKVAWTEADGSIELAVPDSFIEFTPTDVGSVTLRGQTARRRIVKSDMADGVIRWTLVKDRQSAYTSEVEGVPIPEPTPPPATITGATILAVMDIPSRIDTEDDLNIYYGVTGAMPAWYGAVVQRSIDAGANYSNIVSINSASIIGYITGSVADASEHVTDTTNTITVTLYRDGQVLESISDIQFLQEMNPFALEKADGSWEIMQFRDAELTSNGDFLLSTLHRGQLNSGTSSHADGSLFVMLERPTHITMPSSLIGVDLTHRAPSFEQSPELAAEQTAEYVGRSQTEWEPAYLELTRDVNDISASWVGRGRFGSDINPIMSINFQGYRVTIDDGVDSVSFDTTDSGFTDYDASALSSPVTVSVSALNRITGAGPATSGSV